MSEHPGGRKWEYRSATDPFVEMRVPTVFGSIPTVFGAPLAETTDDIRGADFAFLGIPWSAPPSHGRVGSAAANYVGTNMTPDQFRVNSLKYGGYLPELDLDVFEHLKIVDVGNADVSRDMTKTLASVESDVRKIVEAGAIPITMGGNSGPGTHPVIKVVAEGEGAPLAILDFDAHHDNQRGEWQDDNPRAPRWGSTWARRAMSLPGVDPARFYFVGLRGPRNDRETFLRFEEVGIKREHLYTYTEIKKARRSGYDEWAEALAKKIADGAGKVWIHMDVDVLDLSSNPGWADEPLGMSADECIELLYQVGKATGKQHLGGLSFIAVPYEAQTLHYICAYMVVYLMAGVAQAGK
jgi:agmatinase